MIGVEHYGNGPENALALHCMLARGRAWAGVAEALADRISLTAPDHPGHGRAPDWEGTDQYDNAALARAAQCMPAPPVHLIGHSFGGVLALRLAAARPSDIASLTLIEPVWFALAKGQPGFQQNEKDLVEVYDALHSGGKEEAARLFTRRWGVGIPWGELAEAQRSEMTRRMPLFAEQQPRLYDWHGLDAPDAFGALRCPVLLLSGAESPPVIEEIQSGLARLFPAARRVVVPGAGHMLPITHPGAVAAEIGRLLDEAGRG